MKNVYLVFEKSMGSDIFKVIGIFETKEQANEIVNSIGEDQSRVEEWPINQVVL